MGRDFVNGIQPNILLTIQDIREVSEHPYLYDSTLHERELTELINTSARLQITVAFLERIKKRNEKVIIFSERREIQRLLQRLVWEQYGIVAKIVNGDTPASTKSVNNLSRQACVDAFNKK